MGPRTASVSAGGQQGFIQRKTALSKQSRLKSTDCTADSGAPRGPGRYLLLLSLLPVTLELFIVLCVSEAFRDSTECRSSVFHS